MAEHRGQSHGNDLGHWERWDIVALNDEMLELFNRSYTSALHDYPLAPAWWIEPRLRPILNRAKAVVAEKLGQSCNFGFKDPRLCKLLPAWKRIFFELRLRPRYIVCIRNPAHVSASLYSRDHTDIGIGEYRWLDYTVDCLRYTEGCERIFVNYEDWFSDASTVAGRLVNFMNIGVTCDAHDLQIGLDSIVQPDQNHEGGNTRSAANPLIRSFYNRIHTLEYALDDDPDIRKFIEQYVAFRQLLHPFSDQTKKLSDDVAGFKVALDTANAGGLNLAAQVKSLNDALTASEASVANLATERVTDQAIHASAQAAWSQEEARLLTSAAELDDRISSSETNVERLRDDVARLAHHETAWRGAEERYSAAEFARVETVNDLAAAREEIVRLETALAEVQREANDGFTVTQSDHLAVLEKLEANIAQNQRAEVDISRLERELAEAGREIARLAQTKADIDELEHARNSADQARARAVERLGAAFLEIERLQSALGDRAPPGAET